jgi:hypothetical protein
MIDKSPTLRSCHTIIPTSQDSNTPEGLESWFNVGIHRILAELPHSTKLELGKLRRTQTNFSKASTLELLEGLLTNREVLQPSESHLSLSLLYKK